MAVNSLFLRPKIERKYLFRKFYSQILRLIFGELPHTLLIEPIGPREEVFPKIGSPEFCVTSCTIIFYPWKRTKLWIFREIVFSLQSLVDIFISTFQDLCFNLYVRLDRSTWIWAVGDNTAILAITVPCRWGKGRKYNQIVGNALPELGSNRSKAQMQDLKKLNWRHGYDEFWKQTCHVYSVVCKRPFQG